MICWTTEYYGMGIGELRSQGREVPDELLSFIAPGHRENINFFGFISVDIEAELAKLIEGWRPLRSAAVTGDRNLPVFCGPGLHGHDRPDPADFALDDGPPG